MNTKLRRKRTIVLVALFSGTLALGACGTKVAADGEAPPASVETQVSGPSTGGGGGGAGTRVKTFE